MSNATMERRGKFHKFDEDVDAVLRTRIACTGNTLVITGPRLDPQLYKRVNRALELLGGKWKGGKVQAHVFPGSPKPLIDGALGDGKVLDRKKTFQFFETPTPVARRMVDLAEFPGAGRTTVLEPSAGRGAIADVIRTAAPYARITCVELDDENVRTLAAKGYEVSGVDFLRWGIVGNDRLTFDRILMNPPFSNLQDVEHVRHAFDLLKPGGRLVAIMSPSPFFREDGKSTAFRNWLKTLPESDVEDLPAGTFASSGTDVSAKLIVIDKPKGDR